MEPIRCEALILKVTDYRENDRLVTCYSLEHGLLRGIARGAKRSVRRFGGALELFARLSMHVRLRQGLVDILDADIVTIHAGLRADLSRIAQAGYACELLALLAPEGVANPRLYRLASSYLAYLESASSSGSDRRFFELNLLNILGYRPSLEQCSSCGAGLGGEAGAAGFSASGELYCRVCHPGGSPVSGATLALLAACLSTGRFGGVQFPDSLLAEAGMLLDAAIAGHVSAPLRSLAFLREMEPSPAS
jgi:DNA repair protein RecO (recombination protein O)